MLRRFIDFIDENGNVSREETYEFYQIGAKLLHKNIKYVCVNYNNSKEPGKIIYTFKIIK